MARPQDPRVKEAIIAALLSGCRNGNLAVPEKGPNLSKAWELAFLTAFDAARPAGKFESWTRKSLPKIAAYFHVAKLETTSPKRSDAIQLSAAVIFETQRWELHAREGQMTDSARRHLSELGHPAHAVVDPAPGVRGRFR